MDSALALITVLSADIQLLVECSGPVNQLIALFLKNGYARTLSKALLLPFRQSAVLLVDRTLLSGSDLLLLVDGGFERFDLPLKSLV